MGVAGGCEDELAALAGGGRGPREEKSFHQPGRDALAEAGPGPRQSMAGAEESEGTEFHVRGAQRVC